MEICWLFYLIFIECFILNYFFCLRFNCYVFMTSFILVSNKFCIPFFTLHITLPLHILYSFDMRISSLLQIWLSFIRLDLVLGYCPIFDFHQKIFLYSMCCYTFMPLGLKLHNLLYAFDITEWVNEIKHLFYFFYGNFKYNKTD